MGQERLDNAAPKVYDGARRERPHDPKNDDPNAEHPIDDWEIFDLIRDINDPEHPYTLEQLNVVQLELIKVHQEKQGIFVDVQFTPTIPHCSMATLIGLAIKVKLTKFLHPSIKTCVSITPNTHNSEEAINRQLSDKERVAAAMENSGLMHAVNQCLEPPSY